MSFFGGLLKSIGIGSRPAQSQVPATQKPLRASYDASKTTNDNKNHWANADGLSPNASVDPFTRRILRNRSRYEIKNNSYLCGMIRTKANYVVGRGPRLQLLGKEDKAGQKQIERDWKAWCRATKFCQKLRTLVVAKYSDGEAIGIKTTNRQLLTSLPVSLDLRLYEADQIADPWWLIDNLDDERRVDGLKIDANGTTTHYHVLHYHPGSNVAGYGARGTEGVWVPSRQVVHLYREDRPGQRRGVPWITPSLPLFSIMRRYTLAVTHNAEWVAELNAVMKSNGSMSRQEAAEVDMLLEIPWARNMLLTLPDGWEVQQLKAEQPTTTFSEFYKTILNEACRCLEIPFNVAAANSSDYNYASGRLDHQLFYKSIEIERSELEDVCVENLFEDWLREYLSQKSGISAASIDVSRYPHLWGWDDLPHVDPQKAAAADKIYWDMGLLSDQEHLLARNKDPDEHYEQLREMYATRREIGMPLPAVAMQSMDMGNDMSDTEDSQNGEIETAT